MKNGLIFALMLGFSSMVCAQQAAGETKESSPKTTRPERAKRTPRDRTKAPSGQQEILETPKASQKIPEEQEKRNLFNEQYALILSTLEDKEKCEKMRPISFSIPIGHLRELVDSTGVAANYISSYDLAWMRLLIQQLDVAMYYKSELWYAIKDKKREEALAWREKLEKHRQALLKAMQKPKEASDKQLDLAKKYEERQKQQREAAARKSNRNKS